MSCCLKHIGEFPHNADINTGIVANMDGIFQVKMEFAGGIVTKEVDAETSDDIVIPKPFSESYLYKFKILDPNGDPLELDGCPNFSLKTYVNVSDSSPCTDVECEEDPYSQEPE